MNIEIHCEKILLRRTKSLCSLNEVVVRGNDRVVDSRKRDRRCSESDDHTYSETSLEEPGEPPVIDVEHLAQKMDRLTDLFLEQCRILSSIKGEVQTSREVVEKSGDKSISQLFAQLTDNINEPVALVSEAESVNSRARLLLDAIEAKQACGTRAPPGDVRDAVDNFLQSDELTKRVVSATAAAVKEVVRACIARDVPAVYLPALQRAQRRLARAAVRTLEEAFIELEEHAAAASRQVSRASRQLRRALDRHAAVGPARHPPPPALIDSLRLTAERVLDTEMKQWRQKILETMSSETPLEGDFRSESSTPSVDYLEYSPVSPQSPSSDLSPIDRLMQAAVINKHLEDGDVNGSFERALCAMDLTLVVHACRAAGPARVFAPCRLQHHVLLALVQQLATDMLTDTQLKCRYLEEAIISLSTSVPETRAHLPVVVEEVRKHLMKFLVSFPNHVASRRITLIVMAADNLLK